MTRDAALALAAHERDRTGKPQLVGMRSDGIWTCREIDGQRFDDLDVAAHWDQLAADDAAAIHRDVPGEWPAHTIKLRG